MDEDADFMKALKVLDTQGKPKAFKAADIQAALTALSKFFKEQRTAFARQFLWLFFCRFQPAWRSPKKPKKGQKIVTMKPGRMDNGYNSGKTTKKINGEARGQA